MKVRHFAIIVPVLFGAACGESNDNGSIPVLPANVVSQRLTLTYLVANAVSTGSAGTTAAAGTTGASGTTGAAGTTTTTTGASGTTGAAGTGSTPAPTPAPAPGPIYQVISTGSTTVDPNLVNA